MKTSQIIIILGFIIGGSVIFAVSQSVLHEPSPSKQCDIPYDENFIKRRSIVSSNDGTPHFSIDEEFSILKYYDELI